MCFSLEVLKDFLIWLVIICGAVALLQLLLRFIRPRLGSPGGEILDFFVAALWIVLWVLIAIGAILFIFQLIVCLGPSLPRLR